ncbi:Signal transduction histidine kinase [Halopenitus malekzadehii]|uniref:Signal transduction histidine kinase n=1 Tax=Halopenitus malekzadehii TaxID=1267564 RepID=A0A1H6I709_9EURY|nr:MEDS domain-containing protein [Halopenitus malekzadehii]SEH42178.1 Signal transduction histidine kinase [Halopenitus malekzadehii]
MSTPEADARSSAVETDALRYESLRAAFDREELGRHLALFYETTDAQLRASAAFIDAALANDQRCLYLADANDPSTIEDALASVGIDVDRRLADGDLEIYPASDLYATDAFDPERSIDLLADRAQATAETDRYAGLAVAGENTWSFRTGSEFGEVLEFEVGFDDRCPDLPLTAMCQYDLDRFTNDAIAAAVWTHKRIVYRDTLCENPFYVPPADRHDHVDAPATEDGGTDPDGTGRSAGTTDTDAAGDPGMDVRLMLEQTLELTHARRQIARREQRLSVVDRALRHNIRNELNVVLGYLELLRTESNLDRRTREYVDTCLEYTERVVDRSEKARHIQGTLEDESVVPVDPLAEVGAAIGRVRDRYPEAAISLTVEGQSLPIDQTAAGHPRPEPDGGSDAAGDSDGLIDDAPSTDSLGRVIAHERLDIAIVELLVNAITHQDDATKQPVVAIDLSTTGGGYLDLSVSNPGPPIPNDDRRALLSGTETPLEHGGGIGLWLVKWIVDASYGELSFPDDGPDVSTVTLTLPHADR